MVSVYFLFDCIGMKDIFFVQYAFCNLFCVKYGVVCQILSYTASVQTDKKFCCVLPAYFNTFRLYISISHQNLVSMAANID